MPKILQKANTAAGAAAMIEFPVGQAERPPGPDARWQSACLSAD